MDTNPVESFATAYAEAVVQFLQTGTPHQVAWRSRDQRWTADCLHAEKGSKQPSFRVDSTWSWLTGPLGLTTEAAAAGSSPDAVRQAVYQRVLMQGCGAEIAPDRSDPGVGARVLVVDDNVDGADSLAAILAQWNMQTEAAYSGWGALRAVRFFRPQAAILDLDMPDMSGFEVAERLKADDEAREIRLIALTGREDQHAMRRALDVGMDVYLVKPAQSTMVRTTLDALLRFKR
jgi:CheY-like chemotaxis protein